MRCSGAFADAEGRVDVAVTHVWRLALIVEKVHPANRADDATGPGVRVSALKR